MVCFFYSFSQNYTKKTINIWESEEIPYNNETINLEEQIDASGKRYSQISKPLLFVYHKKVRKSGAALLYIPGGGYSKVSLSKQGESIAKRYFKMGFTTVAVLKYRLPNKNIVNNKENVPLCDAQKAIALMHRNASFWHINTKKIVVSGSSAGGHLAASLANLQEKIIAPGVKKEELKHHVSILLYPVISFNLPYRHKGSYKRLLGEKSNDKKLLQYFSMENQVSKDTPPTYIIHAKDDASVSYMNSKIYIEQLNKFNIKNYYLELEKGGHGFGLNFKRTGIDWTIQLEKWLRLKTTIFN